MYEHIVKFNNKIKNAFFKYFIFLMKAEVFYNHMFVEL